MRRNKYSAVKVKYGGHTFDSKKECAYYKNLLWREKAGEIRDIEVHPTIRLWALNVETKSPHHVGNYKADFKYTDNGVPVYVDVKSSATITPLYKLKKTIVEANYGIKIKEVM